MRFWLFLICYAPQFFLSFPWFNVLIFRPFPTIISYFGVPDTFDIGDPTAAWCLIGAHYGVPVWDTLMGSQSQIWDSQISTFVKKLTGSGWIWFYEALGVQWYHFFSRTDLLYAVRISTQVFKFLWWLKNKVFNTLSLWGLTDSPWDTSKSGIKVQIR